MKYLMICFSALFYEALCRPSSHSPSHIDPLAINRICRKQLSTGSSSCKATHKRWYYDASSQSCKLFAWTGCGGNENRFESREECEDKCRNILPCRPVRPRLTPDGCVSFKAININDGCPVYHWDCQSAPRSGSCPPAIDIGPLPKDCSISTITTDAGCPKDIVTCSPI